MNGPDSLATVLAPRALELIVLLLATLIAFAAWSYGTNVTEEANLVAPILMSIGLAIGAMAMLRTDIATIWTPLIWCRITAIAYFGVGAILPTFFNEATRAQVDAFYQSFPDQVAKYNLVNCLFMLAAMLLANILIRYILISRKAKKGGTFEPSRLSMTVFGSTLLAVGFAIHFGIALPFQIGAFEGTYPLFLYELGYSGLIGIFLLTVALLRRGSSLVWGVAFASFLFSASGFILFNKTMILLPLIMLAMGFVYHRPSLRRMLVLFSGIYLIYAYSAPLVSFGRLTMIAPDGSVGQANLAERSDALVRYVRGERRTGESGEVDVGLLRLSYLNVGSFAINQYDIGQPGHSLDYVWIVWVPRLLYPDKPIVTDIARDFNYAATGSRESSSSPALPSEGYWNYGWLGVLFFALILSSVFSAWSIYTITVVRSEAWHLFFIILMGMRIGVRVDGLIVTDIIGPVAFAVLGHIALQFLNRLIVRRDGHSDAALASA